MEYKVDAVNEAVSRACYHWRHVNVAILVFFQHNYNIKYQGCNNESIDNYLEFNNDIISLHNYFCTNSVINKTSLDRIMTIFRSETYTYLLNSCKTFWGH